ncbi:hypothetical protein O181_013428 [Austropuccinia psidii MF-1]|uniref:DNA ligase n=1 Tax=Austropuccinia psidii MF-1 TaxID=1389203 RepID=A0A9Q3BZ74_9BASI|nr:hypothetical protein [Austropuccinia psidii MF-1]
MSRHSSPSSHVKITSVGKTKLLNNQLADEEALRPVGPSPPFRELCKALNSIASGPSRKGSSRSLHRRECLKKFFVIWRKVYGNDFYPCVRLLLPHRDRERATYFLKEAALARLYCNALELNKQTSLAAQQLLHWKRVTNDNSQESNVGDFAKLLSSAIQDRSLVSQTVLTIDDINQQLDRLAEADSDIKRLEIINTFLNDVDSNDHLWLLRIILKDLRLGISEYVLLSILHHQALELFNVCTDLRVVCHTLYSTQIFLEDVQSGLQIFNVFKPMMAKRSRKDIKDIVKLMLSGKSIEFLIEEKMDGERMQVHKQGDQYRYWSRNGVERTSLYGANPTSGCLTPYIHSAFEATVEEVILDGEMLVWDPLTEKAMAFGSLKTFASRPTNDPEQPRAMFKVFDILYLKGRGKPAGVNLIGKPLSERRRVMESNRVFREIKTRMELCYSVRGKTVQDIKKSFEKILEERGEGLVVKKLHSKYVLNSRTDDWFKVKPDYMDELGETFDVLAVGGFWGKGKRGGKLGSFLVALVDDERTDRSKDNLCYKSFCCVGTGLSVEETEQIMVKLRGKYVDWDKKRNHRNPDWLHLGTSLPTVPDVWWHFKDSFLLTIKGAEIVPSRSFACRSTLRFPRSLRFDMERDVQQCMSYQELLGIMNQPHTNKRFGDDLSAHVRKRQRFSQTSSQPTLLSQPKHASMDGIFYGDEFWILQGIEDNTESRNELEILVNSNGGKVVHAIPRGESNSLRFCISPRKGFWDAEKVIRQGLNLIHPQWIIDSVQVGYKLSLRNSKYLVHVSVGNEGELKIKPDPTKYEDSETDSMYHKDKDEKGDRPKSPYDNSSTSEASTIDNSQTTIQEEDNLNDIKPISNSLFDEPLPPSNTDNPKIEGRKASQSSEKMPVIEELFYPLVFYLDTPENAKENGLLSIGFAESTGHNELFSQVRILLTENGGRVTSDATHLELTHIICNRDDTSRCLELMRKTSKPKRRRLVLTDWVLESVEAKAVLYEGDYLPPF